MDTFFFINLSPLFTKQSVLSESMWISLLRVLEMNLPKGSSLEPKFCRLGPTPIQNSRKPGWLAVLTDFRRIPESGCILYTFFLMDKLITVVLLFNFNKLHNGYNTKYCTTHNIIFLGKAQLQLIVWQKSRSSSCTKLLIKICTWIT